MLHEARLLVHFSADSSEVDCYYLFFVDRVPYNQNRYHVNE